jgi:hypothetical protein
MSAGAADIASGIDSVLLAHGLHCDAVGDESYTHARWPASAATRLGAHCADI